MAQTFNFWIFGDSFGVSNDITEYYPELKSKYPTIPNRQEIIGTEWVKHIAEHFGYKYDDQFNLARHGKSADWYLMRLYRMIQKGSIRKGDFVLITATAETRFEYSTNIDKQFDFANPKYNDHLKTFHMPKPNQVFGQNNGVNDIIPDCITTYMTLHQDPTWLSHLHLMKHEMIKGFLDSLGINCVIVQSIACRIDTLPTNNLNWGKHPTHPNPMLLVEESADEYNIDPRDRFNFYQCFKNHLSAKQNKVYADQLIGFLND